MHLMFFYILFFACWKISTDDIELVLIMKDNCISSIRFVPCLSIYDEIWKLLAYIRTDANKDHHSVQLLF